MQYQVYQIPQIKQDQASLQLLGLHAIIIRRSQYQRQRFRSTMYKYWVDIGPLLENSYSIKHLKRMTNWIERPNAMKCLFCFLPTAMKRVIEPRYLKRALELMKESHFSRKLHLIHMMMRQFLQTQPRYQNNIHLRVRLMKYNCIA